MRTLPVLLLSVLTLVACDRGPGPAAGATEAQQAAALDACLARALVAQSEESLQALQEWEAGEMGFVAGAAMEFARAFHQHAQLRYGSLAHVDSAVNHARAPADSTRHMQTAQAFLPSRIEPETLEANVASAWLRDFATLRADEDHRCHWDR